MAAVRIRGTWSLTLSHYDGDAQVVPHALGDAVLKVRMANRAGLEGELRFDKASVTVRGKVKPGSPAVVTLSESENDGKAVVDGLEAILYIPPWWPNIDYSYDFITGTLVIGTGSAIAGEKFGGDLIAVLGVQPFD